MTKPESVAQLRKALREALALRNQGSTFPKLSRAQGYVDGYMRALLDGRLATQAELLAIVAEERTLANGPACGAADGEESFAFVRATA